jgi:hypothetical protein
MYNAQFVMRSPRLVLPWAALMIALAFPRMARALDEGDWQVGVTPSLVLNTNGKQLIASGGLRLEGRHALTDVVSAWGSVGSILAYDSDGLVRVLNASAGMTLAFDVLRVLPFVEGGATALDLGESEYITGGRFLGGELGFGAEYLLSRTWAIAPVARLQYFPLRLSGATRTVGLVAHFGVRLARTF